MLTLPIFMLVIMLAIALQVSAVLLCAPATAAWRDPSARVCVLAYCAFDSSGAQQHSTGAGCACDLAYQGGGVWVVGLVVVHCGWAAQNGVP